MGRRRGFLTVLVLTSCCLWAAAEDGVTVTGEVIETSCYIRTGAKGESHRKCAQRCADNGIPLALLDDESGKLIWLAAEDHMESTNKQLRPYIARKVSVTGHYVERSGARLLVIESLTPVGRSRPRE